MQCKSPPQIPKGLSSACIFQKISNDFFMFRWSRLGRLPLSLPLWLGLSWRELSLWMAHCSLRLQPVLAFFVHFNSYCFRCIWGLVSRSEHAMGAGPTATGLPTFTRRVNWQLAFCLLQAGSAMCSELSCAMLSPGRQSPRQRHRQIGWPAEVEARHRSEFHLCVAVPALEQPHAVGGGEYSSCCCCCCW